VKNKNVLRKSENKCQGRNILDGNLHVILKPYFS